ncbi:MAG: hypothetical protein JXQ29_14185 [Planctomycetes bacterium]|nr:hypothetical protein [Planctomycetota bacterium]
MGLRPYRYRCAGILAGLVLALLCRLPAQELPPTASVAKEGKPPLLQRVVVVGASVTHGFGNDLPVARVLEGAIRADHAPVLDASVGLQFLDPVRLGEEQIDRCLEHRATLVVGIDFLFWYAYGPTFRDAAELERRRNKFKLGLAQLERLKCPVVVGDLPDMRGADRRMLHPVQIPSPPVLEALNGELRTWAAGRKSVLVVPLAAWVRTLKAGEWKVAASPDGRFPETVLAPRVALQWDRLHPTRAGTLVLVDRLVHTMKAHFGEAAAGLELEVWRALEADRRARESPPQKKEPEEAPPDREPAR